MWFFFISLYAIFVINFESENKQEKCCNQARLQEIFFGGGCKFLSTEYILVALHCVNAIRIFKHC